MNRAPMYSVSILCRFVLSDVPGPARPKSPGSSSAFEGLGLEKLKPDTTAGSIFSTDLNVELNVGATLEIQIQV